MLHWNRGVDFALGGFVVVVVFVDFRNYLDFQNFEDQVSCFLAGVGILFSGPWSSFLNSFCCFCTSSFYDTGPGSISITHQYDISTWREIKYLYIQCCAWRAAFIERCSHFFVNWTDQFAVDERERRWLTSSADLIVCVYEYVGVV